MKSRSRIGILGSRLRSSSFQLGAARFVGQVGGQAGFGKLAIVIVALGVMSCGRTTTQAGPPIPYDDNGACPFQCCTYREWSVDYEWGTDLRSDRHDEAPVAFHAAYNDIVQGLTGVVTTTKVGRARASRQITVGANHQVVPPGETIYLLRNLGGGDWKIWFDGVVDRQYIPSQGYCTGDKQASDECAITITDQPETVWWAKVQNSRGQEGWTREIDHFGNIDACG